MKKVKLEPNYRYFTAPHPAVVVGTFVNGKPTYNTLGDYGILCAYPLHIFIASVKTHYTNIGVRENGTFSVNIPHSEDLIKADYVGSVSGHKQDKSEVFDYELGDLKNVPLISEYPASLECKVLHSQLIGQNEVFMAKVHAIYLAEEAIKDDRNVDYEFLNPPTLFANGFYYTMGEPIGKSYEMGKKYKKLI
jgi:flavin reductase (DIM6/NTAB) family NADH-FMN oxidoreductase RutF